MTTVMLTITPTGRWSASSGRRLNFPATHAIYNGADRTFCGITPGPDWTLHQQALNRAQGTVNCKRCLRVIEKMDNPPKLPEDYGRALR